MDWNAHDPATLNDAMDLALEFGRDCRKPIQARLQAMHPDIGLAAADAIDTAIRDARDRALAVVARHAAQTTGYEEASSAIRERLPWIDAARLGHPWSQGVYLAMK